MEEKPSSRQKNPKRGRLAIVSATMADFANRLEEDEENTRALFEDDAERIAAICKKHKGAVLNRVEGGLRMNFKNPGAAVRCSLEIQKTQAARNLELEPENRLEQYICIHLGEIGADEESLTEEMEEFFALALPTAEPGGITISEAVYNRIKDESTFPPSIFDHDRIQNKGVFISLHHILVGSSKIEAAKEETASARAEARREAAARKEAEEQAAAWLKLEMAATEAKTKAQQEAMEAKMKAIRESMAREKAENEIALAKSARDRSAKQRKWAMGIVAVSFCIIIGEFIIIMRPESPRKESSSNLPAAIRKSSPPPAPEGPALPPPQRTPEPVEAEVAEGAEKALEPAAIKLAPAVVETQPKAEGEKSVAHSVPEPSPAEKTAEIVQTAIPTEEIEISFPEEPPPAVKPAQAVETISEAKKRPLPPPPVEPLATGMLKTVIMADGKVLPSSVLKGIQLSIDGKSVPFNNGLLSGIESGTHQVHAAHPDFLDWRGNAEIKPNATGQIVLNLTPKTTPVSFTVRPITDFKVFANGQEFFILDGVVDLPAGIPLGLEIKAPPFKVFRETVRLKASEHPSLNIRLNPNLPSLSDLDEEPKIYRRPNPSYPSKLWKAGIEGTVELQFVVSKMGQVENKWVMNDAHPDLAQACLKTLDDWRFEPGKWGDSLTAFYSTAVFEFPPKGRVLWEKLTIEGEGDESAGNFSPPKPVKTVMPLYPPKQYKWLGGVAELVEVSLSIDEKGTVADYQVRESSSQSFDEAIGEVLSQWKFDPARKEGKPVLSKIIVPFEFKEK